MVDSLAATPRAWDSTERAILDFILDTGPVDTGLLSRLLDLATLETRRIE